MFDICVGSEKQKEEQEVLSRITNACRSMDKAHYERYLEHLEEIHQITEAEKDKYFLLIFESKKDRKTGKARKQDDQKKRCKKVKKVRRSFR